MLRADRACGVVETNGVASAYIDRARTKARRACIDQVKIHQAFEGRFQRGDVVVAEDFEAAVPMEVGRRHTQFEKAWRAAKQGVE